MGTEEWRDTVPHPCPIVREVAGNHGDERAPLNAKAPDHLTWSGAVSLCGGCGI